MAGSAASESILFIGSLIAATAVVGVLGVVAQDVSGGLRIRGNTLSKELGTDIDIINDPMNVNATPLQIFTKNTGGTVLTTSLTNIFLDGVISASPTYDVLGSADDARWRPGEVVKITAADLPVALGDHRVRVVAETGIQADLEFNRS